MNHGRKKWKKKKQKIQIEKKKKQQLPEEAGSREANSDFRCKLLKA